MSVARSGTRGFVFAAVLTVCGALSTANAQSSIRDAPLGASKAEHLAMIIEAYAPCEAEDPKRSIETEILVFNGAETDVFEALNRVAGSESVCDTVRLAAASLQLEYLDAREQPEIVAETTADDGAFDDAAGSPLSQEDAASEAAAAEGAPDTDGAVETASALGTETGQASAADTAVDQALANDAPPPRRDTVAILSDTFDPKPIEFELTPPPRKKPR